MEKNGDIDDKKELEKKNKIEQEKIIKEKMLDNSNKNLGNEAKITIKNKDNKRKEELYADTNHKPIPIDLVNKALKSVCKIIIKKNNENIFGTGFFININNSNKYLITNYHIISESAINNENEIEIYNKKKMKLVLNNRFIKFFPFPKDITIIELKKDDELYEDIELLNIDINYYIYGYNIYQNVDIFSVEHPFGKKAVCASGKVINVDEYEFSHNIPTEHGSSGCPIILLNDNINLIQVIGIHKSADNLKRINWATFIGEIFDKGLPNNSTIFKINGKDSGINNISNKKKDINPNKAIEKKLINIKKEKTDLIEKNIILKNENKIPDKEKKIKLPELDLVDKEININKIDIIHNTNKNATTNIIKAEIKIEKGDINKDFQIINCHEYRKIDNIDNEMDNKEEIQENVEIKINGEKIEFSFYQQFKKEGKHKIEYLCKNNLTKINHMFCNCAKITKLDFSNFNSNKVINMRETFYNCQSLTNLDLSNFNTQNVKDMGNLFYGCISLTNLNLSNFNTQNVKDISFMFFKCELIKALDLSNFNTQNVKDMGHLFHGCKSLTYLNLSNFNTKNVINMSSMFYDCELIKDLNLSNFNTQNVWYMNDMFSNCESLTILNLSNFEAKNIKNANEMFYNCKSLKYLNLLNFNIQNIIKKNNMPRKNYSLTEEHFPLINPTFDKMFLECQSLNINNIITNDKLIIKYFLNENNIKENMNDDSLIRDKYNLNSDNINKDDKMNNNITRINIDNNMVNNNMINNNTNYDMNNNTKINMNDYKMVYNNINNDDNNNSNMFNNNKLNTNNNINKNF